MAALAHAEARKIGGDHVRTGVDLPPGMLPRLAHRRDALRHRAALGGEKIPEAHAHVFRARLLLGAHLEEVPKAADVQRLHDLGAHVDKAHDACGKTPAGNEQLAQAREGHVIEGCAVHGDDFRVVGHGGEDQAGGVRAVRVKPSADAQAPGAGV